MTETNDENGSWEWVPDTAVVVYPKQVVQSMLGHGSEASTRKEMSRYKIPAVTGYEAAQVDWMMEERHPELSTWKRTPKTS